MRCALAAERAAHSDTRLTSGTTVNNPINVNGVAKEKPKLAPEIGQHSIEVLRALGYDEVAIQALIRSGVIASPGRSV